MAGYVDQTAERLTAAKPERAIRASACGPRCGPRREPPISREVRNLSGQLETPCKFSYLIKIGTAREGAALLGMDPSKLLSVIDASEAAIEKAGVVLYGYTAPGHGPPDSRMAKVLRTGGQRRKFVDWVRRLIEGKPVDEVHCQKCRVG